MSLRSLRAAAFVGLSAAAVALGLFLGCNAGVKSTGTGASGPGATTASGATSTQAAGTGGAAATSSTGFMISTGASDAPLDVPMNPCGTQCGPTELCDGVHKGIDDNCNGQVDEGCPCEPGQAESCFKGDPSYLNTAGCFPGTQICTELGKWGPCVGGAHANDSPPCFTAQNGCHPINAQPFQSVDLSTGLGNFGMGGTNEMYAVDCPMGVSPCPAVDATGHITLIQQGEYTVTFTETVNGSPKQCVYPLNVGAKGLRVELSWEYGNVDLDLHMHRPGTTTDWSNNTGADQDCGFSNCKASAFSSATDPHWFPDVQAMPGISPVNWFKDPMMSQNTCYFDPLGYGATWAGLAMGCHNPRLDVDDITCDKSVTDINSFNFCAPENINVDYPPLDTWIRIGVNYYDNHGYPNPVHPDVKIYCDGALAGELGKHGFYTPEAPVVITQPTSSTLNLWPVADVMVKKDACSSQCIVKAIYANTATKLPLLYPPDKQSFGPPYPVSP